MDFLKVRKHVYNCNRLFNAADRINVDVRSTENMYTVQCTVYTGEDEKERKESTRRRMLLLLPLDKNIVLKRI